MANADYVASLLPPIAGRNYRAMNDAGFLMEADTFVPVPISIAGFIRIGHKLWGGTPNAACMAARPADYWRCYMGGVALPYIKTPLLVHQESEDIVHLFFQGITTLTTPAEMAYFTAWRANMTTNMRVAKPPHAVFSPACTSHCSSEGGDFWSITARIAGQTPSLREALHFWFTQGLADNWIDTCVGVNCSPTCPKLVAGAMAHEPML